MIETLANFGDFLGGLAVVVSLIYVGLQVKASVAQSRIDSYSKITELWTNWTSMVVGGHEAALLHRGSRDFEALNPVERTSLNQMLSMYFGIIDLSMVQHRGGVFGDEETYRRMLDSAYRMFLMPGVQQWWLLNSGRVFAPNIEKYLFDRQRDELSEGAQVE